MIDWDSDVSLLDGAEVRGVFFLNILNYTIGFIENESFKKLQNKQTSHMMQLYLFYYW